MSFILLATAVIAAAGAAGAAFAKRTGDRGEPPPDPDAPSPNEASTKAKTAPTPPKVVAPIVKAVDDTVTFAALPLSLGDVVSFDREERWLAGALVARDGKEIVGVLFLAPEGAKLEAVAAFPSPRREIFWLSPVAAESGLEPPTSADFGGVVMRRRVRVPVTITRAGQGAPHVGENAIWAEYEASAGARAIMIRGQSGVFAWSGAHCDEGDYDRLGRGENG